MKDGCKTAVQTDAKRHLNRNIAGMDQFLWQFAYESVIMNLPQG